MSERDAKTKLAGSDQGEAQSTVFCAVMFADVVGSTKLYDELGDERANYIISQAINMMREVIESCSGTVVKTIGDEVMCRFSLVDDAATAAVKIQKRVDVGLIDGVPVAVRIGFHAGPVIFKDDGDLFGDTVNVAARVAGIAKGRQIVLTHESAEQLSQHLAEQTREFDRVPVKGKAGELRVSEFVWEQTGVTRMAPADDMSLQFHEELVLCCGGITKEMNLDSKSIQLGRDAECDFIINADLVSRTHANISVKRGKYVLSDKSTNGTFVLTSYGQQNYLRREELVLHGSGTISLGGVASSCLPEAVITYEIKVVSK
jgi:class 3 adenylate cyclase